MPLSLGMETLLLSPPLVHLEQSCLLALSVHVLVSLLGRMLYLVLLLCDILYVVT